MCNTPVHSKGGCPQVLSVETRMFLAKNMLWEYSFTFSFPYSDYDTVNMTAVILITSQPPE